MDDKNKSMLLHIRPVEVEECEHSHGENHRDDAVDALAYCTHDIQSVRHCGHSQHYREIIQNNNYNQVNQKQLKLNIRKVIFNDPATIVFWLDGTKTIVKKILRPLGILLIDSKSECIDSVSPIFVKRSFRISILFIGYSFLFIFINNKK